jgi:TonB family protein
MRACWLQVVLLYGFSAGWFPAAGQLRDAANHSGQRSHAPRCGKSDSTIQTSARLVHSSLTDSLSTQAAVHPAIAVDAQKGALPAWMLALNAPAPAAIEKINENRDPFCVSERINAHNQEIKAIYQRFLKKWPELAGKLTVRIYLHPRGHVHDVEISESTVNQAAFAETILEAMRKWRDFGVNPENKITIYRQQYLFGD